MIGKFLQQPTVSVQEPVFTSNRRFERVLVLGCPGGGKTTFSRELARRSGLPLNHLDDYYWGVGWSRPETDQWISRQQLLVAQKRWIIDGNYLPTLSVRVASADLIVIVDTPTLTCVMRVIQRAWRIRLGHWDELPAEVRGGVQKGRRVAATKDFFALICKILHFRRSEAPKLLELTRSNPNCLRVLAVTPGLWRTDPMRRRVTRSDRQILILRFCEALKFVTEATKVVAV